MRELLLAVSCNATHVAPLSAFADYVAASRSARRREEVPRTLHQLQAHCEALRTHAAHGAELDGTESLDQVADRVYGARGAALYVLQSKINHTCAQPTAKLVCAFTDATIDVVAQADLPAGAEITISYVPPTLDAARRRQTLRASYGFTCKCELCSAAPAASLAQGQTT